MNLRLHLLTLLLTASTATPALAEPEMGRIPFIWIGPGGGSTFMPLKYQRRRGSPGNFTTKTMEQENLTGLAGPELRLRLDLDALVAYSDGYYNLIGEGDVGLFARGGVVLASFLGGRSSMTVSEIDRIEEHGDRTTVHVNHYLGKALPVVYGLAIGTSVFSTRAIRVETELHSVDDNGDYIDSYITREERVAGTLELGFAVVSGQLEFWASPMIDLSGGNGGLRWSLMYAMPAGSIPIYIRASGDHFFGDDPIFGTLLWGGIGIGSSLGVSI